MEEEIKDNGQQQMVTVRLNKYKSFVDALGNRKTAYRVVFTLFLLGVMLFVGITVITLSIKRLYPYSDITTNALGATTIKSEKNEVSYWLFNTAELWADSGIQVNAGDILTIRASGKSNTAIHHLYHAAFENTGKIDDWVGSEGEPDDKSDEANSLRRRYRIFPNMNPGALLMQVSDKDTPYDTPLEPGASHDNFYFIGKERQNIYINHSGTLRFAVNDIVLNRATLATIMLDQIADAVPNDSLAVKAESLKKKLNDPTTQLEIKEEFDNLAKNGNLFKESNSRKYGSMKLGSTAKAPGDTVCELTYYYDNKNCKTVWYDDNIGSFLIIIEKTRPGL